MFGRGVSFWFTQIYQSIYSSKSFHNVESLFLYAKKKSNECIFFPPQDFILSHLLKITTKTSFEYIFIVSIYFIPSSLFKPPNYYHDHPIRMYVCMYIMNFSVSQNKPKYRKILDLLPIGGCLTPILINIDWSLPVFVTIHRW